MPACRGWKTEALAGSAMRRTLESLSDALAPQPAAAIVEQACICGGASGQPSAPSNVLSYWAAVTPAPAGSVWCRKARSPTSR